jgi:ribosomal protein S18 acetylase RimI-like enzyme
MRPLAAAEYDAWLARARERLVGLRGPGRSDATGIVDALVARQLPAGLTSPDQHVLVGDGGEVWFRTGDDPTVLDLVGDPRVVLPVVHDLARSEGATRMKIVVFPAQPELAATTSDLGYVPIATRLRLEVTARRRGECAVALEPMGTDRAAAFVEALVGSFAADLLANGMATDPAAATEAARRQTDEGLAEPGSVVLAGMVDGQQVGGLWLLVAEDEAFVLDVIVAAEHRGRGHGRGLMVAAEDYARDHGCRTVALSVFGVNAVARNLYDSLGYEVAETFLGVDL